MENISLFLEKIKEIVPIINQIRAKGGKPYLVGGSVRDLVLGDVVKDLDIEVHKISLEDLEAVLKTFGPVSLIGKQFGVLKLHHLDIDWSLPRKDSKGRKPTVIITPDVTIEEAARRRDLTMNAMAIDLGFVSDDFTGEFKIIDPYGGRADMKKKVLRLVDKKLFIEDPLRFYRVMQFIGRFEMMPDEELNEVCKGMDLRHVAHERLYEEIKKLLLKSRQPSLGFRWIESIGRLKELFPELGVLVGILQRADYHPERDTFEHTMQCLDAAVQISTVDEAEKCMLLLSALCHDLGKAGTTDEKGSSKGHETAGVAPTKSFLRRFGVPVKLIRAVSKLVRYHRMPLRLVEEKSSPKAYKRLAAKLAPEVTLKQVYWLAWCDVRGRNARAQRPLDQVLADDASILETFLQNIKDVNVEHGPEKAILQGRDLMGIIEPGPQMGVALKKAYRIQIEEGIRDRDELIKRVS